MNRCQERSPLGDRCDLDEGHAGSHQHAVTALSHVGRVVRYPDDDGAPRLFTNQDRVTQWVREVFDEDEATNGHERALRVTEEALELAQSLGVTAEQLHRLVDYVMARPVGEPAQEIAGTMVTLYAAAAAVRVDADAAFEAELARIQQPEVKERVRRRQTEKRQAMVTGRSTAPWIERCVELAKSLKLTDPYASRTDRCPDCGEAVSAVRHDSCGDTRSA